MAAIDLGAGARRVTEFVAGFRRRLACDVTFVHLYWPQEQIARLGLQGARDLLAPDPDVVDNLEPALRASLGPLAADPQVNLSVRPAWGEPAANLLLAAQEQDADLVVVGPEERHGLARVMHPAVATSLARRARYVPVVCLPPIRDREASPAAAPIPLLSTVLAPTDLSPAGNRAALHAYGLLRGRGGVVELCHIHEHPVPNPPYAYDDLRARLSPQRRAALEGELRALIPPDAERLGIATHVSIVEGGEAATAIGQAAARLNVDVICMGSHGRSGLGRALLGSVTAEVARHAGKPLLIVH
jgi:nucleotide-binding universal stress UspA family protein